MLLALAQSLDEHDRVGHDTRKGRHYYTRTHIASHVVAEYIVVTGLAPVMPPRSCHTLLSCPLEKVDTLTLIDNPSLSLIP